jgi:hypothetical protein
MATLVIFVIVVVVWLTILTYKARKHKHHNRMLAGKNKEYLDKIKELEKTVRN